MATNCIECVFGHLVCSLGVRDRVPADQVKLAKIRRKSEEGGVITDLGETETLQVHPSCHHALPAEWNHMSEAALVELSKMKSRQHFDFYIFNLDDDIQGVKKTLNSILKQIHPSRKITVASNPSSWNKMGGIFKDVPDGIYWESRFSISPVADLNALLSSEFLYTTLNDSVKINKARKPPRPHWIVTCGAGHEFPQDFSARLQGRVDDFKPFLVVNPKVGTVLDGLVLSRRLYGGINGERTNLLDKVGKVEELGGSFPMAISYEEIIS